MNSLERVLAALTGQPADRRPWSALLSMYGAHYSGAKLYDHYHDAAVYVEGQQAVRDNLKPDILFSPFAMVALAEAFGGEARYLDHQAPNLARPALQTIDDLEEFEMPDIDSNPRIMYLREATRQLSCRFGGEVAIAAPMLGPLDLPAMMMGLEGWLQTFLFDRDGILKMLGRTVPFCVDLANALLADGAGCVVLPAIFMNTAILPASLAQDQAVPIYHEFLPLVNGPVILHHVGAPFQGIVPACATLPENLAGIVIDHSDDFAACRSSLGPARSLLAGIDGPTLSKYEPEEIAAACAGKLSEMAADPRSILVTTGADVPLDTPPENLIAIREAVNTP